MKLQRVTDVDVLKNGMKFLCKKAKYPVDIGKITNVDYQPDSIRVEVDGGQKSYDKSYIKSGERCLYIGEFEKISLPEVKKRFEKKTLGTIYICQKQDPAIFHAEIIGITDNTMTITSVELSHSSWNMDKFEFCIFKGGKSIGSCRECGGNSKGVLLLNFFEPCSTCGNGK